LTATHIPLRYSRWKNKRYYGTDKRIPRVACVPISRHVPPSPIRRLSFVHSHNDLPTAVESKPRCAPDPAAPVPTCHPAATPRARSVRLPSRRAARRHWPGVTTTRESEGSDRPDRRDRQPSTTRGRGIALPPAPLIAFLAYPSCAPLRLSLPPSPDRNRRL
jgi:hypothetical protein